jgi:Phosphatidylserine decarboxylase
MVWLQHLLPQHLASKLMFRFARIENTWLKNTFTHWFVKAYQVDLSQAKREQVEDYKHFNDFFTRSLKIGARPIADSAIVCPVDGAVSQVGKINNAQILQAKGRDYSVNQLLGNDSRSVDFYRWLLCYHLSFTERLSPYSYALRWEADFDGLYSR